MKKGRAGTITIGISSNTGKTEEFDYNSSATKHVDIEIHEESEPRMKIFIPATERKIRYFM